MKKLLLQTRVIILLIALLLAYFAINPDTDADGVAIRQVVKGSSAELAGFQSPGPGVAPTQREVIESVNGLPIASEQEYYGAIDSLLPNQTFTIQTNEATYRLRTQVETTIDPETNETRVLGIADIGLVVYPAPGSNIRKGLDLSGGTRVVMQPESRVAAEDLELIIENIKERLNVFGLSDIVVRSARDLAGDDFIIVEIAGANKEEVRALLGSQGQFEARIENKSVFSGGDDITFVCRTPECSGIDVRQGGCQPAQGGYACQFSFSISLSDDAAQRQADATQNLGLDPESGGQYLTEPIELYLDDELIDSLNIAADLRGRAVTDIQISGGGAGISEQAALDDALANMKQLQTVLITGSLPVKLEIVKTDGISPVLGAEFVRNAFFMALAAILAVAVVVFIRYRRFAVSIPMVITMLSEGFIILGVASVVGWNIDLAAIAGIIIAIGTGVDHQIVIVDESLRKAQQAYSSWKDRMKKAFFIIFAAYATTVVAMVPLWFAGAGLLRGFAITTILGVTIGVFITRPAFASMVKYFLKEE